MEEIADDYLNILGDLAASDRKPSKKSPLMASSVTSSWTSRSVLNTAEYWTTNMISPVLFSQALSLICSTVSGNKTKKIDGAHRRASTVTDFLEIGPHAALQGPVKDILAANQRSKSITYSSILIRKEAATDSAAQAAGRL
ncbi:hypothetical protein LTR95_010730 [Oleoguttula sp. CCFEE 5521]